MNIGRGIEKGFKALIWIGIVLIIVIGAIAFALGKWVF